MIDFPNAPTIGQVFIVGGQSWTWDGTKWVPSGNVVMPPLATGDNRIINGDMRIDQRNNGAVVTANGAFVADRWMLVASVASKLLSQRNTAGPSLASYGYGYLLQVNTTTAYTPAAGESFSTRQPIEADMVSDFAWGTPNAQPVTLSFMFDSSSLTGTFSGSIKSYDGTRSYPFTFNCPVANVWQKVVITIPGDTAGTWVMSGNGGSMYLCFDLGSGATFRAPAGAWASGNFIGANGAANSVGTLNNQYQVTGVKLETGTVATPFNRQSLAKSMIDCQRYYQVGNLQLQWVSSGTATYTNRFPFPVQMRAAPAMIWTAGATTGGTGALGAPTPSNYQYNCIVTVAAGNGVNITGAFTADAEL